jgi:hypothetical protein
VANVNIDARNVDVDARAAVVAVLIGVANDNRRVGMVDAFGDAGPAIADLIANALGVGGLREHKPERCCDDAKEYFAHETLRPLPDINFRQGRLVPQELP